MSQTDMPDEQRERYKRIKINQIRLDGCTQHRFDPDAVPVALGRKALCLNCGGEMPVLEVAQYVRGFAAAGGNVNLVFPGFWPVGVKLGDVHCPKCAGQGVVAATASAMPCNLCNASGHVKTAVAIRYVEAL